MNYRDSIVWRKSMRLAEAACRAASRIPPPERYTMGGQVTRAAVSVPSNIAEGWSRDSLKDKSRFLSIAHGSLDELNTQLILCGRLGWVDPRDLAPLFALIDDVGRLLTALRRRLRQKRPSTAE